MTDREAVARAIAKEREGGWPPDTYYMQQQHYLAMADAAIAAMGEREVREPDYIYDPLDWEFSWPYAERADLVEELFHDEVREFASLIKGPAVYAARVAVTLDDEGDPDDSKVQWFNSEEDAWEAKTAALLAIADEAPQ